MCVHFPCLGILLKHRPDHRALQAEGVLIGRAGNHIFSLHVIRLECIVVEQNELVRAVLDVELFRGNFRGLIKA